MDDCRRNLGGCGLRPVLKELRRDADDDIRAHVTESWAELMESAEADGDGMDYDGPSTTW